MQNWLERSANSEIVRDGFKVVIVGAPNAGKSSLLNALAGRDAAIVSDEPGTTRDLVDVRLDLGGNLVVFTDTAGIRADPGKIEAIGIERAVARAGQADLVILLEDMASPVDVELAILGAKFIKVGSKSDLIRSLPAGYDLMISTRTMDGIERLLNAITDAAKAMIGDEDILTVQQRQKVLLSECVSTLVRCAGAGSSPDLLAEYLRIATECIGRLTGHVDVEELLGVIFSRFCIGK
jgi:tRNA modification GTPase